MHLEAQYGVVLGDHLVVVEQFSGGDSHASILMVRPSAEERRRIVVTALGHQLELLGGVRQRHPADVLAPQRHHHPVLAGMRGVGGVDPEAGGEHAVVRRGVPPRCTWPSTVVRTSLFIRFSTSTASCWATPVKRS